ncbi:MFS transporter [Kineosporia sp. J2-2]|uniref:MFS transporter n=1 Tax=Kineosporia corallincola TaxID=2835133 RepID=A0ABS5TNK7_9ACTN|nr:MFS transporter [Kineosporia corallincola]MBT0772677.1 MFS transporter [Kineosporia corallincola]
MLNPVRRALVTLAICSFGLGTGEYVALGLLPGIAHDLHVSVPEAGHLISAYAAGVVIGAPLLTAISIRLPRKGLLIGLVVMLAAGNLLSAVMPEFTSLLVVRFLSGLPHGAFFGLASVQAANLVPENRRSQAMAVVFAGLTIANVVGVPLTTLIGQNSSWRLVFALIAAVELVGALGVLAAVPREHRTPEEAPDLRRELRSFRNGQIWLSLAVATIGCGAIFSTFSYIAPMMTEVAGYADTSITPLLVLFGLGMTFGNLVGARLSDRYEVTTVICGVMLAQVAVAGAFYFAAGNRIAAAVMIFVFPFCNTMAFPALQNRIIGMAGGAPNLAAASMHAAFNIANSLGAWLGGMTIAAGWGYNSPNLVAVGLGLMAALVAMYAAWMQRSLVRVFGSPLSSVPPPTNGPRTNPIRIPVVGLNTNPVPVIGQYSNTGSVPVIRDVPAIRDRPVPGTDSMPVIRRHPGTYPTAVLRRGPVRRDDDTNPIPIVTEEIRPRRNGTA